LSQGYYFLAKCPPCIIDQRLIKAETMIIETERLILRKIDPERDFDAWAKAMSDENTVRYLGTLPMTRAQAWRSMAMVMGHWAIRGYGFFSLEHKETGQWVGRVGPWCPEGWPSPEIGWTISPDHLRQGFAIEAARASLDYVINTLGWSSVIHVILEGNDASIAVARKLGSKLIRSQQGLPGVTDDRVLIYGQSLSSRE
jgi:RimJ/RimL family protein N-acetyltransferase